MSASTQPRTPIDAPGVEGDDDAAILATQFRALRHLHSSVEHQLRSPLNSIGLNLELLAAEIADLAKGGDPEKAASALGQVLTALRGGYARLIDSTDSVLEAVVPAAERVETLDLARLARRVAALGATGSVLQRATWQTAVPPVPITVETRRDLLVPALLSFVCLSLEHAGAEARIAFSVGAGPETAEVRAEIEPCRAGDRSSVARNCRHGLGLLARRLGASLREDVDERVFRIHLTLPRLFGAASC
jgi:signal transduction histidine kinase